MDKVKGVLILLTLVFGIGAFYFFVQSSTSTAQLEQAQTTNKLTLDLLRAQGVPCNTFSTDYAGVAKCITPILVQKDFKEDGFAQPDEKKATTGYIVVKNINHASYNASAFRFFVNRAQVQAGCTITGMIDYNTVCRFNFPQRCEDGTVLEVFYPVDGKEVKVFSKNC